jgi:hypothetical protein
MIWDSDPWRNELRLIVERLESCRLRIDLSDATSFNVERDVMVGSYVVRKLFEAEKLPSSLRGRNVKISAYPSTGRAPDLLSWHRIGEFYNLDRESHRSMGIRGLYNQMIHSFIWLPEECEDRLTAIFFSSHESIDTFLYRIEIEPLIGLFREVATLEVTATSMKRNNRGQWKRKNIAATEDVSIGPDGSPGSSG